MTKVLGILCMIAGLAVATLGGLVLVAQWLQWRNNGHWNPVSVGYVLEYLARLSPRFALTAHNTNGMLNRLRYHLLELPFSMLLGLCGSIGLMSGYYLLRRSHRRRANAK